MENSFIEVMTAYASGKRRVWVYGFNEIQMIFGFRCEQRTIALVHTQKDRFIRE